MAIARRALLLSSLFAAGADAGIADKDGVTAVEHARAKGHDAISRILSNS